MKRQQGDVGGGGERLNASKPPLTRLAPGLKYLSPCVRALFFSFFFYDLQLTGGSDSQHAAAQLAHVGRPPGATGPPGLPDATSADPDPRLPTSTPTSTPPLTPDAHKRSSVAASAPLLAARPTFLQLLGPGPSLCLSNTRPAERRDNV